MTRKLSGYFSLQTRIYIYFKKNCKTVNVRVNKVVVATQCHQKVEESSWDSKSFREN